MLWKARIGKETNRVGDTREIRPFAWLPKTIDGNVVWLERYQVKQIYWLTEYPDTQISKVYQVYEWKNIAYKILVKEVTNV